MAEEGAKEMCSGSRRHALENCIRDRVAAANARVRRGGGTWQRLRIRRF